MGVRGLTSYIAKNAERYLRPYELHDCDLVIDGDNLACNLYKSSSMCNSAFGGDYDIYYRTVVEFFQLLSECNIRSYVLLDGGYETRKLRTVERRLRTKVGAAKFANPCGGTCIFPLMMREVFVDAVRDCKVSIMRCLFEADHELAVLSRQLNCPILSYDSDFYIHDVQYIPLVTLTTKALTKSVTQNSSNRRLRHCEAKKISKKKKIKIIKNSTNTNEQKDSENLDVEESVGNGKKSKTYKYLDCCIYTIKNLITPGSLTDDMLPIFAAIIGNDYIQGGTLNHFISQIGQKFISKKMPKQQRRITMILRWLEHETRATAIQKIMCRTKKENRKRILAQISSATDLYYEEDSKALAIFGLEDKDKKKPIRAKLKKSSKSTEEFYENMVQMEDHVSEESTYDETTSEIKESSSEEDDESEDYLSSSENTIVTVDFKSSKEHDSDDNISDDVPNWFKMKVYQAEVPRYFVDLVHLKLYINNPQIENFAYKDCNLIAIDILKYIFRLLNDHCYVLGESPVLRYLSRMERITNVAYTKYPVHRMYPNFDPERKDLEAFKVIFDSRVSKEIFNAITDIPSHLRLYLLAIVYWANKSVHATAEHVHSLIICLIILNVANASVNPIRDKNIFLKKYKKLIIKAKNNLNTNKKVEDDGNKNDDDESDEEISSNPVSGDVNNDDDERSCSKSSLEDDEIVDLKNDSENNILGRHINNNGEANFKNESEHINEKSEITSHKKDTVPQNVKVLNLTRGMKPTKKIEYVSKDECILVQYFTLKFFDVNESFRRRHNDFSSSIIHAFSEFQSVFFHMYSLNILLNYPYQTVKISDIYNGVFLYNIYVKLRDRKDIDFYVKNYIFKESPIMYEFYHFLMEWCRKFLCIWKRSGKKKSIYKRSENRNDIIQDELLQKIANLLTESDLELS